MSHLPDFANNLLSWFDQHGRKNLPWQQSTEPYPVWVSEVMLQQTQVATVIPFYEKFMLAFPDPKALARASLDEVLHRWTGLGYYARARNLHKTANIIINDLSGVFPSDQAGLMRLPGIGRSTAGAIAAICFNHQSAILDGNVKRVLARCFAVSGWPGKKSVSDRLWAIAEANTPINRVANYTQAIMDLGATLCNKSLPDCHKCPLQQSCIAFQTTTINEFPGKKPATTRPTRSTCMLILRNTNGAIMLERRALNGLWGGLFSFPECARNELPDHLENIPGTVTWLPSFKHGFTHFDLDIQPILVQLNGPFKQFEESQTRWVSSLQENKIGMTGPVTRLLAGLL